MSLDGLKFDMTMCRNHCPISFRVHFYAYVDSSTCICMYIRIALIDECVPLVLA